MFQLIAGALLGIGLLSFIHRLSFLGFECFVAASSSASIGANSTCIPPVVVYVLYACALFLVGWGVLEMARERFGWGR